MNTTSKFTKEELLQISDLLLEIKKNYRCTWAQISEISHVPIWKFMQVTSLGAVLPSKSTVMHIFESIGYQLIYLDSSMTFTVRLTNADILSSVEALAVRGYVIKQKPEQSLHKEIKEDHISKVPVIPVINETNNHETLHRYGKDILHQTGLQAEMSTNVYFGGGIVKLTISMNFATKKVIITATFGATEITINYDYPESNLILNLIPYFQTAINYVQDEFENRR